MAKRDPFAEATDGKLTVEKARVLFDEHRKAEQEAEQQDLLCFIGKYFKYRNAGGGSDTPWWLYAQLTSVSEYARCEGWSFQRVPAPREAIEIEEHQWIQPKSGSGWVEISATEFWTAARAIQRLLNARLDKPKRRAQVRRHGAKANG